jgi:t-SNARE complex subunit (syntaxin)
MSDNARLHNKQQRLVTPRQQQQMSMTEYVKRVSALASKVERIKSMNTQQSNKSNPRFQEQYRQLRSEVNQEVTNLKLVTEAVLSYISHKGHIRESISSDSGNLLDLNDNQNSTTVPINFGTDEEEISSNITKYKRVCQEFMKTVNELKNINQQERQRLISANNNNRQSTVTNNEYEEYDDEYDESTEQLNSMINKKKYNGKNAESQSLLQMSQKKKQEELARVADWQQSTVDVEMHIAQESKKEIDHLQVEFFELNTIMRDFSNMVDDQDEVIESIYVDISDSRRNIERGVEDIKVANKYAKSARTNMILLLGISLFVIIVIGLVLYLGFGSVVFGK